HRLLLSPPTRRSSDLLGFRPPETGENYGRVRCEPGPGRLRDRISLRDQRSSFRELAAPSRKYPQHVHIPQKVDEQARLTGGLELPEENRLRVLHVPQHACACRGHPAPAQSLLGRALVLGEDACHPP